MEPERTGIEFLASGSFTADKILLSVSHVKDSNLQAVVNNTVCTPVNPGQDFDLSIVALDLVRPIEREATGGGHVAGTAGPPRSIILPVPAIIVILLFLLSSY